MNTSYLSSPGPRLEFEVAAVSVEGKVGHVDGTLEGVHAGAGVEGVEAAVPSLVLAPVLVVVDVHVALLAILLGVELDRVSEAHVWHPDILW